MDDVEVFYEGDLITRKESKSLGLKRYFTGGSCKYGHIAERYVNSGRCCQCNIESTRGWRGKNNNKGKCDIYHYKELPSIEYLNSYLSYNHITGLIFWKERPVSDFIDGRTHKVWNSRFAGKEAGAKHYSNGYREIRLPNKLLYKAQRLAWKLHHGVEPNGIIDHINGITDDNRIINLREATHQQNSQNMKPRGSTGFKGVTEEGKNNFKVHYCIGDTNYFEKGFSCAEDAARRYDEIVSGLYGDYANLNFPEEE